MGFFKKLGKSLKSVTKAVSLKNGIKLATGDYKGVLNEVKDRTIGAIKKVGQSEIDAKVKKLTSKPSKSTNSIKKANPELSIKQNPDFGDILNAGLGGALTGIGSSLSGGKDVQDLSVKTADNLAGAWLQKNWLKLAGGLAVAVAFVVVIKNAMTKKQTSKRRY